MGYWYPMLLTKLLLANKKKAWLYGVEVKAAGNKGLCESHIFMVLDFVAAIRSGAYVSFVMQNLYNSLFPSFLPSFLSLLTVCFRLEAKI